MVLDGPSDLLMASSVVVDGKNLFDGGGEGVVYLGIGKGTD